MNTERDDIQERDWESLHALIAGLLDRFGRRDGFRGGDYWLLNENWGQRRHQLEFQNLNLLQPQIIKSLQGFLTDYPDWCITIRIDVPGKEDEWPGMGIIVYHDEIIDELQRKYLPQEFRHFVYEGARRLYAD